MSFGENLKTLRKMTEMSQEQLAEKLDVSRQAVSKWETDEGYPETEKILTICKLFDCSMDKLMQGQVEENTTSIRQEYDSLFNRFSKAIALGVGLIIFGVVFMMTMEEMVIWNVWAENIGEALGIGGLLTSVMIAVAGFIYYGLQVEHFKEKHPTMPLIYEEKEIEAFNKKFIIAVVVGVSLILLGVINMVVMDELIVGSNSEIGTIILLGLVTIAVPIFVYFGIQKGKYSIDEYNKENAKEKELEKDNSLVGKLCSVIMLAATGIFLFLGFIYNLWHIAWVVFPLGGILCGIVAVIFNKE